MRKWNGLISAAVLILFIVHGIIGAFQMTDILPGGTAISSVLSWTLLFLVALHTVIGIILTVGSVRAIRRQGVFYFWENKRFLAVRISGAAIMLLIASHVIQFMSADEGAFRLRLFDEASLVMSVLLLISIAVHILCNIAPLLISLGLFKLRPFTGDILLILSLLCLFFGAGFVIYYLRWL